MSVVIVDYQLGNLFSVRQALVNVGIDCIISSDPVVIDRSDAVVLPGVGAFRNAIGNLSDLGLDTAIQKAVTSGKPIMGICLGLQLLFSESEEFGNTKGLGVIQGIVKKFPSIDTKGNLLRVPQIGWNTIKHVKNSDIINSTPLRGTDSEDYFYFVHSYYVKPCDPSVILSKTTYGGYEFVSSVMYENVFACQFHPEKSSEKGLIIYKEWGSLNNLINKK